MYIMENECLKVSVCEKGAELQSIYDKEMEKEILWNGNEDFWNRRSPILFPNVGRHHENFYLYKGQRFDTIQHGFARDMDFVCTEKRADTLVFQLEDTKETRSYFPFHFVFRISYKLTDRSVEVVLNVENKNQDTMYFTIGAHPGFMVPVLDHTKQTDYKLLFKDLDSLKYRLVYGNTGTADGDHLYTLPLTSYGSYQGCEITEHMFDKDALIFDDSQITFAGIGYPDGSPYLTMDCEGFTNFGIWTKPGAPFICLEPWMGRCDNYGFRGDISDKPDIIALKPEDLFHKSYTITVYKKENH